MQKIQHFVVKIPKSQKKHTFGGFKDKKLKYKTD